MKKHYKIKLIAASVALAVLERAKEIAFKDAGVSGVFFKKVKIDYEDGVRVYDVEFYKGNVEYEYKIDAETSEIREKSVEIDD